MPLSILSCLNGIFCSPRKRPEVIIAIPISYDSKSDGPNPSSRSATSLEKQLSKVKGNVVFETESRQLSPEPPRRRNPALLVVAKGQYEIRDSFEIPSLNHDGEVVVRTKSVGLNPIDWKSVDYGFCLPEFPWITGREMAGIVEEVGSGVTHLEVGQRVWTSTYYKDRRAGCFQHYVTVPKHTVLPIPSNMSFEEAACLGVAGLTAAMTLWHWLEVRGSPIEHPETIPRSGYLLIWGGSTITGQFAIQIAALGGLKVIAVTSDKTAELAQKLGATHTVIRDGKTGDDIASEIRRIGGDNITRAIDLVGPETAGLCLKALSMTQRALFAPIAMLSRKARVPANISVKTVEMKQFVLNEDCQIYSHALNQLVEHKNILLPQITVLDGGLKKVIEGLERVKQGDMAGKKLVVTISE